jgi:uncharacterized protein
MKDFLQFVIQRLVDHPEAISIESVEDGRHVTLRLKVAADDAGKVIGKKGNTASALRVLLRAVSAREGKSVELEILS